MHSIIEKIEEQLDCAVSESSFNKDIQQMKKIYTAPIKYDRTHNGYSYTEKGFSIKEFPLTYEEIEALDYSTALLQQLKGTRLFDQFQNAINKVIEGYRISKIIGESESQILQVEEPVKTIGSKWLEALLKAVVEKDALEVTYQGFGKQKKKHPFSPYLLKEYRNRWYVVGYSARVEKIIVLALDRIKQVAKTKMKYMSKTDFSPQHFFKYSFGITQVHDAKPQKVVLWFSPIEAPYVLSQPIHQSQKIIKQEKDALEIELQVYLTKELKMFILSFGKEVRVLQPDSLRAEMLTIVKEMFINYKPLKTKRIPTT